MPEQPWSRDGTTVSIGHDPIGDDMTEPQRTLDANNDGLPDYTTPVSDAGKRVLRTLVQAILGRVCALLIVAVPDLAAVLTPESVSILTDVLTAVLAAAWAWVMSRPAVNRALRWVGLSA